MRLGYLAAVLPLTVTSVIAQTNATFVAEEIAKISPCGVSLDGLGINHWLTWNS